MRARVHTCTQACTHTHMHARTHSRARAHASTHAHVQARTHAHMHTRRHARMQAGRQAGINTHTHHTHARGTARRGAALRDTAWHAHRPPPTNTQQPTNNHCQLTSNPNRHLRNLPLIPCVPYQPLLCLSSFPSPSFPGASVCVRERERGCVCVCDRSDAEPFLKRKKSPCSDFAGWQVACRTSFRRMLHICHMHSATLSHNTFGPGGFVVQGGRAWGHAALHSRGVLRSCGIARSTS